MTTDIADSKTSKDKILKTTSMGKEIIHQIEKLKIVQLTSAPISYLLTPNSKLLTPIF